MLDSNTTQEMIGMSKEVYQLLDTTIKIGLGALISGIVTYVTTKMNHKHEIDKLEKNYEKEIKKLEKNNESESNKYKLQMKIKILENLSTCIEESFIIYGAFLDNLLTISLLNDKTLSVEKLKEKYQLQYKQYEERRSALKNAIEKYRSSIVKLKLLGFNESTQKLIETTGIIIDENNRLSESTALFYTKDDYKLIQEQYKDKKDEYHLSIYEEFEKLK